MRRKPAKGKQGKPSVYFDITVDQRKIRRCLGSPRAIRSWLGQTTVFFIPLVLSVVKAGYFICYFEKCPEEKPHAQENDMHVLPCRLRHETQILPGTRSEGMRFT